MRRISRVIFAICLLAGSAVAQTAQSSQSSRSEDLYRQLWCSGLLHAEALAQKELAERRDARRREYEFLVKMEGFTKSWSALCPRIQPQGNLQLEDRKGSIEGISRFGEDRRLAEN